MVTHHRDLERTGWHRPRPVRLVLVLLGLGLVLAGGVGWSLEQEYGGDPNREEYIYSQEAGGSVQVHGESGVVFEGSRAEVDAWVEHKRGGRDFTVPSLLYTGGALLIVLGLSPSPLKRQGEPSPESGLGVNA